MVNVYLASINQLSATYQLRQLSHSNPMANCLSTGPPGLVMTCHICSTSQEKKPKEAGRKCNYPPCHSVHKLAII